MYLRVWADNVVREGPLTLVEVDRDDHVGLSHGPNERRRHLAMLRDGAAGYGVVCEAVDPDGEGSRRIARFDHDRLLVLGRLVKRGPATYAVVERRVTTVEAQRGGGGPGTAGHGTTGRGPSGAGAFFGAPTAPDATTRESTSDARVGQGRFRAAVLGLWGNRCAVTGTRVVEVVRASHVKPWRDATDAERVDPHNGLPLVATLDALFDAGLLSFADDGAALVSPLLPWAEADLLGARSAHLRQTPSKATRRYLAYHRAHVHRPGSRVVGRVPSPGASAARGHTPPCSAPTGVRSPGRQGEEGGDGR